MSYISLLWYSVFLLGLKYAYGESCVDEPVSCAYGDLCKSMGLSGYSGTKSTTISGHTCQMWSSQSPHEHGLESVGNHNYCRNPDDETAPWCYTTDSDQRWDYCFEHCYSLGSCVDEGISCAYGDLCESMGLSGYRGTKSTTLSGYTCQMWTSQSPHSHSYGSTGTHNYCRNPDEEPGPWCYTTDSSERWELCFDQCDTPVPPCACESNVDISLLGLGDIHEVTHPGYPDEYCVDITCQWTITAPAGYAVKISFPLIETEFEYDYVNVFDGPVVDPDTQMAACSGCCYCPDWETTGADMVLQFVSDHGVTYGGFVAHIEVAVPCVCESNVDITLLGVGDLREVTSPGYPGEYCDDITCQWTVTAPVGYTIRISFPFVDTEFNDDHANVFDGPVVDPDMQIAACSGSACSDVVTTGPNMVLQFVSDDAHSGYDGFVAHIEVNAIPVTTSLPIVIGSSDVEASCSAVDSEFTPTLFFRDEYGDRCYVLNRTLNNAYESYAYGCNGFPNSARLATFETYNREKLIILKDLLLETFGMYENETMDMAAYGSLWIGLKQRDTNVIDDGDWYWILDGGQTLDVPNPDPEDIGEYFLWPDNQPNDSESQGEYQDCGAFSYGLGFAPTNIHDWWCYDRHYSLCQFGEEGTFNCTCRSDGKYVANWGCTIPNKEPCACAPKYFECISGTTLLKTCPIDGDTVYDRISKSCKPKSETFDCLPAFRTVEEQFCYDWTTTQNPTVVSGGTTCYMLNRTLSDYATAKTDSCPGFGDVPGHLASFDTAPDWVEMRTQTAFLLTKYIDYKDESGSTDDNNYWVGLEQTAGGDGSGAAKGWSWLMDGPSQAFPFSPNLWGDNQPDDNGDEDCGVIRYQTSGTYLDDKQCTNSYYSICELPMPTNIATMEFDCSSLPDGNYKHQDSCSRKFFSCWTGVTYYRLCPENQYYEQYSDTCTPDISLCGLTSPPPTPEPDMGTCTTTSTTTTTTSPPCMCEPNVNITLLEVGDVREVTSPGYPGPYCVDITCQWTFTAPVGYTIKISFPFISTEYNYDHANVFDGPVVDPDTQIAGDEIVTPPSDHSIKIQYLNGFNTNLHLLRMAHALKVGAKIATKRSAPEEPGEDKEEIEKEVEIPPLKRQRKVIKK